MRTTRLALSLLLLSVCFSTPTFAQPAPDAAVAAVVLPSVPPAILAPDAGAPAHVAAADLTPGPTPDTTGTVEFLRLIIGAAKAGNWKLAIVLGLVMLIWLTRKYGSKIPGPVGKAIASDAGGVITAFLWSFIGVLSAALSLGLTVDLRLVGEALLLSFTAMGGWVAIKKILPESWKAKVPWLFGDPAPADPAKP